MKKYYYLLVFLLLQITLSSLYAQNVGINSTGALPDSSSVLDLNSTSMGLLTPRMTTTQMNAIVRPATGLMIYNTTLSTFEVNSGTSSAPVWVTIITSLKSRTNYVLVKSASDLPAAVGGVRTLDTHTLYEINGTVVITDKIDLNGASIIGQDAAEDILVYPMTSGELFTGANGGSLKSVTLAATGVGSKLFNINANGTVQNFIMVNCFVANCNNIGLLKGFGGSVFMETVAFQNNTNGITYENNTNLILVHMLWDNTNHNSYEKLVGTFNVIQLLGGDRLTTSAYSAIALDITGLTTITVASLKTVMYTGTGTFVNGAFSDKWEVESTGLNTEKDDVASGNIYITTSTPTVFTTVNVPVKILGTTATASLFRVTSSTNNRLTYTGNKTRRFQIISSLSLSAAAKDKNFSFYIAKNGVIQPESRQTIKLVAADKGSITLSCTMQIVPNDYVEVWVENNVDVTGITVESLNLCIK